MSNLEYHRHLGLFSLSNTDAGPEISKLLQLLPFHIDMALSPYEAVPAFPMTFLQSGAMRTFHIDITLSPYEAIPAFPMTFLQSGAMRTFHIFDEPFLLHETRLKPVQIDPPRPISSWSFLLPFSPQLITLR